MKNLINHMRSARVKRSREAHMRISTKLIDSELSGYDKFVDEYNRLQSENNRLKEMLAARDNEIAQLKQELSKEMLAARDAQLKQD